MRAMSPSQTRPIEPRSEDAAHQGETPMIIVRNNDDSYDREHERYESAGNFL